MDLEYQAAGRWANTPSYLADPWDCLSDSSLSFSLSILWVTVRCDLSSASNLLSSANCTIDCLCSDIKVSCNNATMVYLNISYSYSSASNWRNGKSSTVGHKSRHNLIQNVLNVSFNRLNQITSFLFFLYIYTLMVAIMELANYDYKHTLEE